MPDTTSRARVPRVGFIGTGLIGTPMVERLLEAGLAVTVWNRTVAKTAPLVAVGAVRADTARDLAKDVDIVCLCLTDTNAVDDVMFGDPGIAGVMQPGQLLIDFSSIAPDRTAQMAARLQQTVGADWVDAPVSGGLPAARGGRLIVFAGGDAKAIVRGAPVFDALSQRVTHMGGNGAGQLAKSCNQMIVGCNLLVIAEMLAFASAAGIEASRMPEALAGGFADSQPLKIFGPRMARGVDTPRIGALATFRKDVDQVVRLAAELGAMVPMTQRAAELYREAGAHADVGADADVSRVIRLFQGGRDAP
jgi:3-hydroxyisobutyrate dehydrogenase